MKTYIYKIILGCFLGVCLTLLSGCDAKELHVTKRVDRLPTIFPDYTGVTIAPNLVAPRFWLQEEDIEEVQAIFNSGTGHKAVSGDGHCIALSERDWHQMFSSNNIVNVEVKAKVNGDWIAYKPFNIYVANEPIDKFIAYRLIEPGYETWNEMGIYQRCLENYIQRPIVTNRQTNYGCMNCHSFCKQDPDKMLMHMRVECAGTYIIDNGEVTKLNTKTPQTISALVYPQWHPSGDYVAFSTNTTNQMFHTTDPNRIEVYDNASDVVVYDIKRNEIVTAPQLSAKTAFETFPTFSPDGRTLYYCSADSVKMPDDYEDVKYSICSIAFDPEKRMFGTEVDTLFSAKTEGKSASFPRVSPDGRYLMFTRAEYGNFSIWHRDADIYLIDLQTREIKPAEALNSDETESYHSWSSNGRWVVFSSRRMDGLYTRPYIAYFDKEGNAHKPLLLPPSNEVFYERLMKSYNVPEFIAHPVTVSGYDISHVAKTEPGIDVKYSND